MYRRSTVLCFLVVSLVSASAYAAEIATFTLKDGSTRQAQFLIMKDNYIFVNEPRGR